MDKPSASEGGTSRRTFLVQCFGAFAGLTIIGTVAPTLSGCSDATSVDPNFQGTFDVSSLTADGTALLTTSNGGDGFPIIIVRNSSESYTALSAQCTHEACQVNAPSSGRIDCTCHGSQFDLTGKVLHGPAEQPLYSYSTTYDAATKTLTIKAA